MIGSRSPIIFPLSGTMGPGSGVSPLTPAIKAFTGANSPQAYTLAAAAGSYTETGVAAPLKVGHALTASVGSYALAGQASTLKVGHVLSASVRTYAESGQAATLLVGRVVSGAAGAYVVTGKAATLQEGHRLTAGAGACAASGVAAELTYTGAAAAVVASGGSAGGHRRKQPVRIPADAYATSLGSRGRIGAALAIGRAARATAKPAPLLTRNRYIGPAMAYGKVKAIPRVVASPVTLGKAKATAKKNPSDEELLLLLARIL